MTQSERLTRITGGFFHRPPCTSNLRCLDLVQGLLGFFRRVTGHKLLVKNHLI
ncbi:MAG: hypothetical protein KKC20_23120 [Proteobacteria bacterium]|nr:hypothetical protein [Pseudomonadota bacterium]